ncbi:unnamed protein product, partial [Lymnaea stagnalis]
STGFGSGGSAFGAQTPGSGTNMFGGAASGTTAGTGSSLFGQSGNTGFGQPQSTNAFSFGNNSSGGLFGNVSQPGTGSLFSSPGTGAGFGAKTGFSGFGTAATNPSTGGLFGSATSTTSSLFGQPSATAAFGGVASISGGTTIAFNPPAGQDTMMKGGVTTNINTRHQCITAMKEYENKSLEELRVEDYTANRKAKQAGSTNTGGLFGQTQGAQPTAGSGFVFGGGLSSALQPSNTTGFGGFGNTSTPSTASTFNQNRPSLFGTATTTQSGFGGFGSTTGTQQSTSLFGTSAAKPLFGTTGTSQPTGSSFFQTSTSNPVGFGTSTQSGGLFGSPKPAGFGTATTSSIGFGTPATSSIGFGTGGNLFAKPASTASSFGGFGTNTSTGGFGTNTSTTGFGSGGLFSMKPTGFGTTSAGLGSGGASFGFGGGLGTGSSTSAFGTGSTKPGFGFNFGGGATGSTGFGSMLNTGSNTGTFSLGGGTSTLGAMVTAPSQVTNTQHLLALASSPYGDNPLFWNLKQQTKERRDEALKPTNPNAQKAALTSVNQYKVSHRPTPKLKPKSLHHLISGGKAQLFEGLEDEDFSSGENTFVPRKSVKKLVLRKAPGSKSTSDSTLVYSEAGGDFSQLIDSSNNKTLLPLPITRRLSLVHDENSVEHEAEHTNASNGTPAARNLTDRPNLDENTAALNQRSNNGLNAADTTTSSLESSDLDNSCLPVDRSSPHPTGVTLTRPGYYTIPPLDEMINSIDENGDCVVEDLVIGRIGYGHVLFHGLTNVAGLNLDELVHFRRKEIVIYPDDDRKPPLGQGLNKKAEVTLEYVWPMDKTSKTPIQSPERLQLMNYTDKIEAITEIIGAKFIDYRMETGSWVFEVSHFSRYSLLDHSDYYLNEHDHPGHDKSDLPGQTVLVSEQ